MKSKRKFLCMLMGFIFVFMVGCGSSKSISSKGTSKDNTISQSENQTKSDENTTQKDKNNKEQDKNSNQKDQSNKEKDEKNKDKDSKNKSSEKNEKTVKQDSSSKNNSVKQNSSAKNNSSSKSNVKTSKNNKSNTASSTKAKSSVSNTTKNKSSNTFTIIISKEEKGYTGQKGKRIATKTLPVIKDKNAMNYLRDNFSSRDSGGFIYEISGIHNNFPLKNKTKEQKKLGVMGIDWFIYLNGKKTPVGANDVYPKAGDVLQLDIHQWDNREYSAP